MRFTRVLLALTLSAWAGSPQTTQSVAERIAAQNKLFTQQYESDLRNDPERATAFGDYRYNDKLGEESLAAIASKDKEDRGFLARLKAIATTGFPEQDQLSHDLLVRILQTRISAFDLKEYEMPVNQQNGIHTSLADLPLSVPLDSVKHYEDYISRLHQIPRVLDQTAEVLRAGKKDGLMPVRFLLGKLPGQCEGIIASDPFLTPTTKYPPAISRPDRERLTKEIREAVDHDVLPAYRRFSAFLRNDYAPYGRSTLAITSLPDGVKRYQNDIYSRTSTNLFPDEIHRIGLRESIAFKQRWSRSQSMKAFQTSLLSARHSSTTPNTFRSHPIRSSKTFAAISLKWSQSCRNSSTYFPKLRLLSKQSPHSRPLRQLTI